MTKRFFDALNVKKACGVYGIDLWQCPHFLFIIMGIVIIVAIIVTNITARIYTEPEVAALIVLAVAAFLFIIGTMIVKAFEKVAQSSLAKSEFISIVSHEMRNPLSTVRWQIDLLMRRTDLLADNELKEAIATISDHNGIATRLVNELIEVYKLEDNKMQFQPAPFSLKIITERSVKNFLHYASASNIRVSLYAADDAPMAFADAKKIQIVIEHLIDNAIRYTEGGGEVVISIEKEGNRLRWSIADQGVGMPAEEISLVFSKFFRSHNRLRYHSSGLGLGLYLSRSIIRASGGDIHVRSIEGQGTTFWFTLPISPLT